MKTTELVLALAAIQALTAAPHVSSVVNSSDYATGIPLGGFGTVFGTALSDAVHQATALPFPTTLGPTQAALCAMGKQNQASIDTQCQRLQMIYVSEGQINFMMPKTLATLPGFTASNVIVVVLVNGIIDDGAANADFYTQRLGLGAADPRIVREGYDCFIDPRFMDANRNCGLSWTQPATYAADRGAVTDLTGRLISSSNPAHLNQNLVLWATGLGSYGITSQTTLLVYNVPVYGYNNDTYIGANVSYAGESQFPGLYQVNFQVPAEIQTGGLYGYPPAWPCGNYSWEVSLSLRGANPPSYSPQSNLVQIPVVIKSGDVACKP